MSTAPLAKRESWPDSWIEKHPKLKFWMIKAWATIAPVVLILFLWVAYRFFPYFIVAMDRFKEASIDQWYLPIIDVMPCLLFVTALYLFGIAVYILLTNWIPRLKYKSKGG